MCHSEVCEGDRVGEHQHRLMFVGERGGEEEEKEDLSR